MKNYTVTGIALGLILTLIIVLGSWQLFLTALIFGTIGGLIGAHFDGRINLVELFYSIIGKGRA